MVQLDAEKDADCRGTPQDSVYRYGRRLLSRADLLVMAHRDRIVHIVCVIYIVHDETEGESATTLVIDFGLPVYGISEMRRFNEMCQLK